MTGVAIALLMADIMSPSTNILVPCAMITNGWCDADSVTVQFGTTNNPPPYMVGLYDALDYQFGAEPYTRSRPLNYRIVNERQATLAFPTRTVRERCFVQVLPTSWTNEPGFGKMTLEELRERRMGNCWSRRGVLANGEESYWHPRPYVFNDGCSPEVSLPVLFKSLSADNGKRVGYDWLGNIVFIVETNAVPNRIYWEGL